MPETTFTYAVQGRNLVLNVAGPGTAAVSGAPLLGPSSASGGPGTIVVPLNLTGKAKKQLKRKSKLKVILHELIIQH